MRVSVTEFENGYVLLCSDETALRRAARNLRTVVNTLQKGVVVVDRNGWLLTANPAARRILGLGPGQQHVHHGEMLSKLTIFDEDGVLLAEEQRPIETVNALNREGGSLTAVLFIDLDDLKTVNDNFGHDAGDRVIQTTADRRRRAVRKHDIVGRLAGDEFVALCVGNLEPGALEGFVGRIRRVLSEPIEIPGGTI
jgi:PAS domain-containing protein